MTTINTNHEIRFNIECRCANCNELIQKNIELNFIHFDAKCERCGKVILQFTGVEVKYEVKEDATN